MKHATLVLVLASLLAVPAAAQRPAPRDTSRPPMAGHMMPGQGMGQGQGMQGGMMGGMMHGDSAGGMMESMMAVMAAEPDHLLARKAALRLTAGQERQVTAIRDAAGPAHDAAMRDAETHQRELDQVMRAAAPDTAALRTHFQAAHTAMGQAHLAMLRSAALARAVLTDAQRRQLDSLSAPMRGAPAQPAAHRH
ncbi:MAG: Spy/CpxP family protein refolding chaperone [Gemmatimonadota bacterium]